MHALREGVLRVALLHSLLDGLLADSLAPDGSAAYITHCD